MMKNNVLMILMMVALLAVTACNDNDEPNDAFNDTDDSGVVYVTITDNGQDYIYNLNGEMIYHTEPNSNIIYLAADGQDWYACVFSPRDKYSIIKNGTTIYEPAINRIRGLAAGNGDFYTLEAEPQYTQDIHFPSEYARIYSIHKNGIMQYDLGLKINAPYERLRLRPTPTHELSVVIEYHSGSDHQLWVDGQQYPLPEMPVDPDHLSTIDIENNDLLILYWEFFEGSQQFKYWHDNKIEYVDKNLLARDFGIRDESLYQGKVYILGTINQYVTKGEVTYIGTQPVLYIDGKKKTFDTMSGNKETARKMRFHGNSIYVLTDERNDITESSHIYKGQKPLKTDSIYLQSKGKKVLLGDLKFNDLIVVDK